MWAVHLRARPEFEVRSTPQCGLHSGHGSFAEVRDDVYRSCPSNSIVNNFRDVIDSTSHFDKTMLRIPMNQSSSIRSFSTSAAVRVPLLVSPKQLVALPKERTKILDVSWHMPNSPRDPKQEYLKGPRIPHAIRWDLDQIATKSDAAASAEEPASWKDSVFSSNPLGLGHMFPSPATFAQACSLRGIKREDHVVLYDSLGVFSSPRGAWTFKAMGHEKVSVLDGGLPRYLNEGLEVENQEINSEIPEDIEKSQYAIPEFSTESAACKTETPVSQWFNSITPVGLAYEQVVANSKKNLEDGNADLVLDARARERWTGEAPEPRAGLSSGHIPHSLSLPFKALLSPASADKPYENYLPTNELRDTIISALGGGKTGQIRWEEVKRGKRGVVWSCGSGMTAAVGGWAMRVLAAAEERDEGMRVGVYDESWTGYAMRKESEIVKGNE